MKHFFDMDGTLAVYDWWVYKPDGDAPWYEKIRGTHYYRHCKSHPKMVDFVNGLLRDCPEDVYILTSAGVPEEDYYEHVADKIIWIQKHVKGLLPEHFPVTATWTTAAATVVIALTAATATQTIRGWFPPRFHRRLSS